MNRVPLLLDTNIAILILNGDKELVEFADGQQFYISFISEIELLGWPKLTKNEKVVVNELISSCYFIDYSSKLKLITIDLIRNYQLKIPDAFIAAVSIYYNIPLFTSDKIFNRVKQLTVISFDPATGIIS